MTNNTGKGKRIPPTLIHVMTSAHRMLMRVSGGALGNSMAGAPVCTLTTTGRKSGQPRSAPLLYLEDNGRWIIVASFGGNPRHPAWWLNLQANPNATLQIGKTITNVTAREATDAEREELWPKIVQMYADFDQYRLATERKIPVGILEPTSN